MILGKIKGGGDYHRRNGGYGGGRFFGGARGRGRGGGGFGSGSYDNDGGEIETVFIESSEVGRIIGRGGSVVRQIEEVSGCRMKVSRDRDLQGRSSIDLRGGRDAIAEAKRLIQVAGVELLDGKNSRNGDW